MRHKAITRRIDFNELIGNYGSRIQLLTEDLNKKFDDRNYESTPLAAYIYAFSDRDFEDLIDHIVEFTFDETFKMIKRNLEDEKDR